MGYTHYFEAKKEVADDPWDKLCEITKQIIAKSDAVITAWYGPGEPEISNERIALNGDPAHESFHINRMNPEWNFCKTAQKQYDEVVVAILIVAESLGILTWSSDGSDEYGDFDDAKVLLEGLV